MFVAVFVSPEFISILIFSITKNYTIRSSLTEDIHLRVLAVIRVSRSKNNAALVFVVSCEKGEKI